MYIRPISPFWKCVIICEFSLHILIYYMENETELLTQA